MDSNFICAHCGRVLAVNRVLQTRERTRGHCSKCDQWTDISLPTVRKKLIYLDQSFLSAVCLESEAKPGPEARLLRKLENLKAQQKIFLVVSDIHSLETSAIPVDHAEKRKKLWQFQNALADGKISNGWAEVFIAQQRRAIRQPSDLESYPYSDLGLPDPHRWQAGMRVQMTNHWRVKLHDTNLTAREDINKQYRKIIEKQASAISNCTSSHDILNHIHHVWRTDIGNGIAARWQRRGFLEQLEKWIKQLENGQAVETAPHLPDAPLCKMVGEVLRDLPEEPSLEHWLKLLNEDATKWCASLRLRTSFEAALLANWRAGIPPTNPKTFHIAFGISRQNDINHLSANIPYVDAVTTDNSMLTFCAHELVAEELTRYQCKLFAKKTYGQFESWLDELLSQPISSK